MKIFLSSAVFDAKFGHLATPCLSSKLQNKQDDLGVEVSGAAEVGFFTSVDVLSDLALFGNLPPVDLV